MRWSYKTIHYELKKEGFLGSAFLDEAEVEQSLNEYGLAGWELVFVTETQDGLIAIFKQPLDLEPQLIGTAGNGDFLIDDDGLEELITEEDIIVDEDEDEIVDEIVDEIEGDNIDDDGLDTIRIE